LSWRDASINKTLCERVREAANFYGRAELYQIKDADVTLSKIAERGGRKANWSRRNRQTRGWSADAHFTRFQAISNCLELKRIGYGIRRPRFIPVVVAIILKPSGEKMRINRIAMGFAADVLLSNGCG
jgi:hypothetical protein